MAESLLEFLRRVVGRHKNVEWIAGGEVVGLSDHVVAEPTDQRFEIRPCEAPAVTGGARFNSGSIEAVDSAGELFLSAPVQASVPVDASAPGSTEAAS